MTGLRLRPLPAFTGGSPLRKVTSFVGSAIANRFGARWICVSVEMSAAAIVSSYIIVNG